MAGVKNIDHEITELKTLDSNHNLPAIWQDEEASRRALKVCRQMALAGIGGPIEWTGDADSDKALLDQRTAELFTKLAYGCDVGMPPSTAMAEVFITEGKPNIGGQAAMGIVEARGGLAPGTKPEVTYTGEPLTDEWCCEVITHPALATKPVSTKRCWKEVKKFGQGRKRGGGTYTKATYQNFPAEMLLWRTYGLHCKTYYKAFLGGMALREDIYDARVIKDIKPVKQKYIAAKEDPALKKKEEKADADE